MGSKIYSNKSFDIKAKDIAFSSLFNILPINFSWFDKKGYILGCNQTLLDLLYFNSFNEIYGKHSLELFGPIASENTQKVMDKGESLTFEEIHFHKGKEHYFLSIKSPIKSCEGEVVGITNIAIDITDRKNIEKELKIQKEKLERSDKIKTEFLANMRHDLRMPLNGIISISEFLAQGESDPSRRSYLNDILDSSNGFLNQLNEILTHVDIKTGNISVYKDTFSCPNGIKDIYNSLKSAASDKKIEFTLTIDPNFPEFVCGDSNRIQRILTNLISNAIKFTHKGYVHIVVDWIKKDDKEGIAHFIIEDTGIGIPSNKKDDIFKSFYKLSPSYRGILQGTGLGLTIVKNFLEEIGGELNFTSLLHEGSTFEVCIPYLLPIESMKPENVSNADKFKKILLVEDFKTIAKISKDILESLPELNCKVDIAENGQKALELIEENIYDLVLLDIGLPDIEGYTVAKCIRSHDNKAISSVPIVAITGHAKGKMWQECFDSGATKVFEKPLTMEVARSLKSLLS